MVAAGAMALSSLSVLTNVNRLRGFQAPNLPANVVVPMTEPVGEIRSDEQR